MRTRHRGSAAAALCVAALLTTLLAACTGGKNAVDQNANGQYRYVQSTTRGSVIPVDKRKAAGDFNGPLLPGDGAYALKQDAGNVVVLSYFASWCGPCQTETPQLDALYRQRKASGTKFVGIDVKDPSKSAAQSWVQDKALTFPIVYDQTGKTALELGNIPTQIPMSVVIDKQGRVAAVYFGSTLPADLTPVLDTLAKEV
ncbi:TlpA disulfide reductase family protein [Jatrophihabitans sp. DSM 45814]